MSDARRVFPPGCLFDPTGRCRARFAQALVIGEDDAPGLHATVAELAARAVDCDASRVFVVPGDQPNAFAPGRSGTASSRSPRGCCTRSINADTSVPRVLGWSSLVRGDRVELRLAVAGPRAARSPVGEGVARRLARGLGVSF